MGFCQEGLTPELPDRFRGSINPYCRIPALYGSLLGIGPFGTRFWISKGVNLGLGSAKKLVNGGSAVLPNLDEMVGKINSAKLTLAKLTQLLQPLYKEAGRDH